MSVADVLQKKIRNNIYTQWIKRSVIIIQTNSSFMGLSLHNAADKWEKL